jgi:hypothetical protein|tara:strand:+ start:306 stop:560 length:255 start_codon:yes stop_codon:yes gene_type:complete
MKTEFRVINRTTKEEQVFNSKELQRFFYCEYDVQTGKIKYNNEMSDYAISQVKPRSESFLEALAFGVFGLAIIILTTKLIMSWI